MLMLCGISEQAQIKMELEKGKSQLDELSKTKSVLEKNNSKLTVDLKTLKEKTEKVRSREHCSFVH